MTTHELSALLALCPLIPEPHLLPGLIKELRSGSEGSPLCKKSPPLLSLCKLALSRHPEAVDLSRRQTTYYELAKHSQGSNFDALVEYSLALFTVQ